MWGAAATLYELATNIVLFPGTSNNDMIHRILRVIGPMQRSFATYGDSWAQHFSSDGLNFLNAGGDYAVRTENPAVVPMSNFQGPQAPILLRLAGESVEDTSQRCTPSSTQRLEGRAMCVTVGRGQTRGCTSSVTVVMVHRQPEHCNSSFPRKREKESRVLTLEEHVGARNMLWHISSVCTRGRSDDVLS